MALHVAVDARAAVEDTRGIGRYLRAILRRLAPRDDVALTLVVGGLSRWGMRVALERAVGSHRFRVCARVPRNADVLWNPANGTFLRWRGPSVATIHDAVPFRFPHEDRRHRRRDQLPFLRSVERAVRVIAVSRFGADEIHAVFGVPRERIAVIYHGVSPSFTPGEALPHAPLEIGGYLLFVGDPQAEPRKNFDLLYEAHRAAWPQGDGPPIAVAGTHAPQREGVVHAGHFADDLASETSAGLRNLYRGALAVVVPSYHETFGMPLVEAMACGTPVLASAASSLPEIGDDAVLFAPPRDVAAWSAALRRITEDGDERARLIARGFERAAAFQWNRSAEQHVAVFRDAAAR
ncbi:MAG TPA: glycosyltransferase family 1 protein [Candidatus Dormibacteraeota bacterium]|nr:glycosyltransferase family 1 protein [Candidatus Dormibacteraeota bacterium]